MISDLRSQSHPSLSVKGSPGPWSPSPSEPARPAHGTRSVLPTFRFSAAVSSCIAGTGTAVGIKEALAKWCFCLGS